MRIDIRSLGGANVLAGELNGKRLFGKLLNATVQEPLEPEAMFFDFVRVKVATASYLRESILKLRDVVRSERSNFYPVVANANADIRAELRVLVVGQRSDVLIACDLKGLATVKNVTLIGDLEPVQRKTFDLVRKMGETDASELMHIYGSAEQTTRTTAWNNRLASLTSLGLIVEVSQGRAKRYKPLFKELNHGL
jgi:hypothetical protein